QRAEVIGIAELAPQLLKDFPVPVARHRAVGLLEMLAQMSLHAIVVDQRVVDVEQENDVGRFVHFVPAGLTRPCTSPCPCRAVPWRPRSRAAVRTRTFARVP